MTTSRKQREMGWGRHVNREKWDEDVTYTERNGMTTSRKQREMGWGRHVNSHY